MGSDDLYSLHRPAIEQAIRAVCRRQRIIADDADDFAGAVRLHLVDRDFSVLRRFQGRSRIETYLVVVITHLAQDWRNARWGKWRPSAEARRQGPIATELERLIVRDGLTFDEAYETLRTNAGVAESRADLEAIAAALPVRVGRHFVPDDQLAEVPAPGPTPDHLFDRHQAGKDARAAIDVLRAAVEALPPQDALILKLRFQDGLRLADIARSLHLDEKPLYRRVPRLLAQLRTDLQRRGLTEDVTRGVLARMGVDEIHDREQEIGRGRPSLLEGSDGRD